jgi:hypothetical protein
MDIAWTAAVPYDWNRTVSDPKHYEVWLTKEEVAVDGTTVRSYADGDTPFSPLQVQNGGVRGLEAMVVQAPLRYTQSSTGQVAFSVSEKTKGTFTYRLLTVATTGFAAAHSPSVKITVS